MLVPVAPIAPRAILPDDPGVALRLASTLLEDGRLMANHHRGLWGYTGSGRDGLGPLTIQSTGVGATSAGLVLSELLEHGLTIAIRAGTARGFAPALSAGDLYAVTHAEAGGARLALDAGLSGRLAAGAASSGVIHSAGADDTDGPAGAAAIDLETAQLARIAARSDLRFASVLVISATPEQALDHEALADAVHGAGVLAAEALTNA